MNRTLLTSITAALALAIPGTALAAPKIDGEFPVSDAPRHLTQGPDGNIWAAVGGKVARVTPQGQVTEFDPANVGFPSGITTGPDGMLWVTQSGGVARFSPADPLAAEKFDIAVLNSPQAIVTGPDGNLWTASGDDVVKIPPANPAGATSKAITGMDARGITSAGGRLWVVDRGFNQQSVRSVTTDFATITPHPVGGNPQEVAPGPNGQVAYTNQGTVPHEVGRISAAGATPLKTPSPATDPFGITFGPDGAYWYAEFLGDSVGRLTTDGKVTHLGKFSAGSGPRHITAGPDNTLWVALEQGKKIGRVTGVVAEPAKPPARPGSAPGDSIAPAISRLKVGRTKVSFRLSEKAAVRIKIKRRNGRSRTLKRSGKAGANSVRVRRLRPGRYRVTVTAKDPAGNRSAPKLARLKLARR